MSSGQQATLSSCTPQHSTPPPKMERRVSADAVYRATGPEAAAEAAPRRRVAVTRREYGGWGSGRRNCRVTRVPAGPQRRRVISSRDHDVTCTLSTVTSMSSCRARDTRLVGQPSGPGDRDLRGDRGQGARAAARGATARSARVRRRVSDGCAARVRRARRAPRQAVVSSPDGPATTRRKAAGEPAADQPAQPHSSTRGPRSGAAARTSRQTRPQQTTPVTRSVAWPRGGGERPPLKASHGHCWTAGSAVAKHPPHQWQRCVPVSLASA